MSKYEMACDASYNAISGKGSSVVLLYKDGVELDRWGRVYDECPSNNYGLELKAALAAVRALTQYPEITEVDIIHDLEASGKFATGVWKGNKKTALESLQYRDHVKILLSNVSCKVNWVWTKGHIGHIHNEAADLYAKQLSGVKIR